MKNKKYNPFRNFSLNASRDRKLYKKKTCHYDKGLENNLTYINYFKTSNFQNKI